MLSPAHFPHVPEPALLVWEKDADIADQCQMYRASDVVDTLCMMQVGAAADVAAEALRCVDVLRERLRKAARAVAGAASRPRVMILESVKPLTLGKLSPCLLPVHEPLQQP